MNLTLRIEWTRALGMNDPLPVPLFGGLFLSNGYRSIVALTPSNPNAKVQVSGVVVTDTAVEIAYTDGANTAKAVITCAEEPYPAVLLAAVSSPMSAPRMRLLSPNAATWTEPLYLFRFTAFGLKGWNAIAPVRWAFTSPMQVLPNTFDVLLPVQLDKEAGVVFNAPIGNGVATITFPDTFVHSNPLIHGEKEDAPERAVEDLPTAARLRARAAQTGQEAHNPQTQVDHGTPKNEGGGPLAHRTAGQLQTVAEGVARYHPGQYRERGGASYRRPAEGDAIARGSGESRAEEGGEEGEKEGREEAAPKK